ncbi:MAG: S-DNA-T family DNA segregation ATPase FtsK/SpoIIIE, partial [Verrucomicrobiales bacterium]
GLPAFGPGRALFAPGAMVAQVIDWEPFVRPLRVLPFDPPPSIEILPERIHRNMLPAAETDSHLSIPVGVGSELHEIVALNIRAGEHALVAGPSQSGRTSALRLIAAQLRAADPNVVLVGISPTPTALLFEEGVFDATGVVSDMESVLTVAVGDDRRWVVLVDDAERIDVDSGCLVDIARNGPPHITVIAAVRSSVARQAYGHWTRYIRASGAGIVLQPDNAVDGDLFGIRLPRSERVGPAAGRGYLICSGDATAIQICE